MKYKIDPDFSNVVKLSDKINTLLPKQIKKVINDTAKYGLRSLVDKLPHRTGNLRKKVTIIENLPMTKVIGWKPKEADYADAVEYGSRSAIIKPKAGRKYLAFPIDKKAMVASGARAKAGLSRKYWEIVFQLMKQRVSKFEAMKQASEKTGMAMAKEVHKPAIKGQYNLKRVTPVIQSYMNTQINKAIKDAI